MTEGINQQQPRICLGAYVLSDEIKNPSASQQYFNDLSQFVAKQDNAKLFAHTMDILARIYSFSLDAVSIQEGLATETQENIALSFLEHPFYRKYGDRIELLKKLANSGFNLNEHAFHKCDDCPIKEKCNEVGSLFRQIINNIKSVEE